MAHGRTGPDIVMNIRYAAASEIRAVSFHEENRDPDGSSAIDPDRSHLNRLLWSLDQPEPILFGGVDNRPKTQQTALEALWASGVQKPAAQSEAPYVQMVLSASPEYFRDEGQGPGEWKQERLTEWLDRTMTWLRKEYGDDLVHVSLHLDEDTPHLHVLIVPTYQKKPRKPGRRKRNETEEEFEQRKADVENAPRTRVAGRASNDYWKKAWARREARKSYHSAVEPLGISYGKDFVGSDEPSPEHVKTGTWVREQASFLKEKESALAVREAEAEAIMQEASTSRAEAEAEKAEAEALIKEAKATIDEAEKMILEATSLRDRVIEAHAKITS